MTHACRVDDCGRSCPTCGERITCLGPDPVPVACSVHNDECAPCNGDNPCRDCAFIRRATARADAAWEAAAQPGPYIDAVREAWIDHRAELRAEDAAYELAQLKDREERAS